MVLKNLIRLLLTKNKLLYIKEHMFKLLKPFPFYSNRVLTCLSKFNIFSNYWLSESPSQGKLVNNLESLRKLTYSLRHLKVTDNRHQFELTNTCGVKTDKTSPWNSESSTLIDKQPASTLRTASGTETVQTAEG